MKIMGINEFDPFGSEKYAFCESTTKKCVVNEEHLLALGIKKEIKGVSTLGMPCVKPLDTIISANYDSVDFLYQNKINELQSILGVRKGENCGLINMLGVQIFPLLYCEIICPINSSKPVFCVKRTSDYKWAAIDIFGETIVPFGKYIYMWGFDHDHCLVSTIAGTFKNRAIIDINGEVLISPNKYIDIYGFRGKKIIKVEDHTHNIHALSVATLTEIASSNVSRSVQNDTDKSITKVSQKESNFEDEPGWGSYEEYGGYNGYDDYTIDSAFDGDPEATWNID